MARPFRSCFFCFKNILDDHNIGMKNLFSLPCLYGVGFYNNKNCAISYVDGFGNSHIVSKKNKIKLIYHDFVFLRGFEYLIFGMYFFIKNLIKMPFEFKDSGVVKSASKSLNISLKYVLLAFFVVISAIFALFIFGYLPIKISVAITNYSQNAFFTRFIIAIIKIVFLYILLISVKYLTCFRQFYRFNSCGNVITFDSCHRPTNFLNYIVFAFCLTNIVVSFVGLTANNILKPIINLLICLFCFTISYEILLLLEKSKFSWLRKSCIITSFLVNEKPTNTEIYIALSAFSELKFMNTKKREEVSTKEFKEGEVSFSSVYAECKLKLKDAGISEPSELDFLLCEVLNVKRGKLRLITKIKQSQKKQIDDAIKRRINGEPITKIFGHTNFYGYDFIVTKDVLSPRQETEILVETVLKNIKGKMRVLDLCTGSGVIAICVAKKSQATVVASDISSKALDVAQKNAEKNNVKIIFKKSDLFLNLKSIKKFDIIVSNPPYIPSNEILGLDVEVKDYDPLISLDGGDDGLRFYEQIILEAPLHLNKGGKIFFEVGKGQSVDVVKLLEKDFENIKVIKDYNKINRVVYATKKSKRN